MTPAQLEAIRKHGQNLLAIFPNATEKDPVKLCKKLRRLEAQAAAIALRLCNGPEYPEGKADELTGAIIDKVDVLLGNEYTLNSPKRVPVFINRDPRGYALKIDDEWIRKQRADHRTAYKAVIHQDWGGYGIIAPEIDGEQRGGW